MKPGTLSPTAAYGMFTVTADEDNTMKYVRLKVRADGSLHAEGLYPDWEEAADEQAAQDENFG